MNTRLHDPRAASNAAAMSPVRLATDKARARILYAEDDLYVRSIGQRMLTLSGYDVDTASDGAAAWAMLHGSTYDLLLTDNDMPQLTGVELIRKLRLAGITVPVILTSATFAELSPSEFRRVECEAMLAKPFEFEQLRRVVHEVLQAAVSAQSPNGVRVPAWEEFRNRPELPR